MVVDDYLEHAFPLELPAVRRSDDGYSTCETESQCTCPTAPLESCNLKDDNCDNNCDDFASCRAGVHRSSKPGEHFYTTSLTEAACCGFTIEFLNFHRAAAQASGRKLIG